MIRLFLRKASHCLFAIIFLYIGILMLREGEDGIFYLIFLSIGSFIGLWQIFRISSMITMGQLIERTRDERQLVRRITKLVYEEEGNGDLPPYETVISRESGKSQRIWTLLWMTGIIIAYNALFHSLLSSQNQTIQITYMMVIVALTFLLNFIRVYYERIVTIFGWDRFGW